ncbi:SHOCT domain-containing protein [Agathobaculum sp. NTUH-O15-33]|uniref:SHOCT domain-containing protein n=1 Tax=Agathobaculum sp. NTUH-O15-33 TaxID=3079302 RepID=UPI0029583FFD|nr:SHOCT domain-containing protein [Agathobaculum sp. NTUH-O15-33]WNX86048.1 SHOCT domain-containing protein [Agathobaculum sp. NTUH-O15-33]
MDTIESGALRLAITDEQMQNEFDYMMAQQQLKNMLKNGLISLAEFDKISALNLEIFSPELASIMA